ncbi:MAG: hypothetical protein WC246_02390 [Candidatus Paceibacterota bacterium]|jgi:hypothetical protein
MKITTQRILFSLSGIVVLVGALCVYTFFIQPEYGTIMSLRGDLASKTDAVSTYRKTIEEVNNLTSNLGNASAQQQRASMILPIGADMPYFSNQIVGIAQQNGVVVDSIDMKQQAQPTSATQSDAIRRIVTVQATVHVSAGYTQLKSFLQTIQNNVLLMNVSGIDVQLPASHDALGSSKNTQTSMLTGTVSILSYYQENE